MGWVEGFEPSATGTTIRRSTKLSYTHRKGRIHRNKVDVATANFAPYKPASFQSASTRRSTSEDMRMTPGHGRVNPSAAHFRVASMPIFEP